MRPGSVQRRLGGWGGGAAALALLLFPGDPAFHDSPRASSLADTAFHWTVGSRVHTVGLVCARPDTLVTGTGTCGTGGVLRATGDKGTIVRGPAGNSTPFGLSWYIHYDTPPDGWSTQKYLALDSLAGGSQVVAKVTLSLSQMQVFLGTTTKLAATLTNSIGAVVPGTVTWTATGAASVDTSGRVTATSVGTGTVTATSQNGVSGSATVTVVLVPVRSVSVTPAVDTEPVGSSVQLTAQTFDSAGHLLTGRAVTWSDSTRSIISVSPSGMVGALSPGTGRAWATSEGLSAMGLVVVVPTVVPPPAQLAAQLLIVPPGLTPGQGARVTFYAVLRDSTGSVSIGVHSTWSSSDTTVAKIDSSTQPVGIFFANPGVAVVTAKFGLLTATVPVNVMRVSVSTLTVQFAPCVVSQVAPTTCGPYPVVNNGTGVRVGSVMLTTGP